METTTAMREGVGDGPNTSNLPSSPTYISSPKSLLQKTTWSDIEVQVEQELIESIKLSPLFSERVNQYNQLGNRGEYLWKWCVYGLRAIVMPCAAMELREHAFDTKMLAVLFGVLLDDVADQWQDRQFLELLLRATVDPARRDFNELSSGPAAYARFTCEVWDEFQQRVSAYPRYLEFGDLLNYDNQQVLNTMWYSHLVNADVSLLNIEEHDVYSPHNMQMISFSTIDLMCSLEFDHRELGSVRGAMWHAQCMGRIGNLVSTWERELKDGDYSSGVFAILADRYPQLTIDMLLNKPDAIRAALTQDGIESVFLEKWDRHRVLFEARFATVRSVDLRQVLLGLDQLLRMEIGSRGRK